MLNNNLYNKTKTNKIDLKKLIKLCKTCLKLLITLTCVINHYTIYSQNKFDNKISKNKKIIK